VYSLQNSKPFGEIVVAEAEFHWMNGEWSVRKYFVVLSLRQSNASKLPEIEIHAIINMVVGRGIVNAFSSECS